MKITHLHPCRSLAWQHVQTQPCLFEVCVEGIWVCATSVLGYLHMVVLLSVFEHIVFLVEILKYPAVLQVGKGRHCLTVFTLLIPQLCNRPLHSYVFGWMHLNATEEIYDCVLQTLSY